MAERRPRPVLTGIDGSPGSTAVTEAAAGEALRRGLPLRLVLSRPHPLVRGAVAGAGWQSADRAEQRVNQVVRHIRAAWPSLRVDTDAPGCDLVDALVAQSPNAALLVIGIRHLGGYDRVLGRWLDDEAVTHAHCPILVVRPVARPDQPGLVPRPVLVGVDGSEHCAAAMAHAVEEALLRGVPLWAVSVHCVGARATAGVQDALGYGASVAQVQAAEIISRALAGWADRLPGAGGDPAADVRLRCRLCARGRHGRG